MHQINMDIIINLYFNRKRAFLLSFFLLVSVICFSQQTNFAEQNYFNREQLYQTFKNKKLLPSSLYNYKFIFHYGKTQYHFADGDFQHPQKHKKQNGLSVSTASFSSINNTSWKLYGALNYLNIRKEDVAVNQSFQIRDYLSPYYFFQNKKGYWNHQAYSFNLLGVNDINNKLTIGASLNYDNNQLYRKTDSRNETNQLSIPAVFSATYKINNTQSVSAGIGTEYFKAKTSIYNKYPQNNSNNEYTIYLNTGLGSYLKNIGENAEIRRDILEFRAMWYLQNNSLDISFFSQTKFGNERWINPSISSVNLSNNLGKYKFTKQHNNIVINKKVDNKQFLSTIETSYITGKGEAFNQATDLYNQNFTAKQFLLNGNVALLSCCNLISKVELGYTYNSIKQNDFNYGYQFDYTIMKPQVKIGVQKDVSEKTNAFLQLSSAYRTPTDVTHNPYAANNLYVDWVGNVNENYLSAEAFEFSAMGGVDLKITSKNILELTTKVHNINNQSKLLVNDVGNNYLTINGSAVFCF